MIMGLIAAGLTVAELTELAVTTAVATVVGAVATKVVDKALDKDDDE